MWCLTLLKDFYRSLVNQLVALTAYTSSLIGFIVNGLALLLAWIFLPLESAAWQAIIRERRALFPQIRWTALRPLDPVRIVLQTIFLFFTRLPADVAQQLLHPRAPISKGARRARQTVEAQPLSTWKRFTTRLTSLWENRFLFPMTGLLTRITDATTHLLQGSRLGRRDTQSPAARTTEKWVVGLALLVVGLLGLWCITQPLTLGPQLVFVVASLLLSLVFRRVKSHLTILLMIVFSIIVSTRYLFWRATETLSFDTMGSSVFGLLLLGAEIYAYLVMVLSYFQVFWVLERKPVPMPADISTWPHVDICIPTYNEPLDVIKPTVLAAQSMDWPAEKLHIWILDDGSRDEFTEFAKEVGIGCIRREIHNHAKAGNINHALQQMSGDFVAIFDCDHVPVRSFLQMTVGWLMKDPKIALVQTPHHFYSQDPFSRNLGLDSTIPDDNALFHDFIQKGNDAWDATMFCGSCAVMRRKALDEVGGIAVETVTEDAHTSLKLNRRGWSSAFIGVPLAAGLSTETLSAHVGQRIRWARGMIQIFRVDNPLKGDNLTWGQRLCFFNAMIHFLHGLPRLIFLLAPLPYIFFGSYVFDAPILTIFAFAIPHMLHATLTTGILQRGYRSPFLGGIYEAVLSWYILLPTTVALINPKYGKFNVTVKGGTVESQYLDWQIIRPYLVLMALNVAGLIGGIWLLATNPTQEIFTLINIGWILYNLVILGATIAVAVETVQERRFPRVPINREASIKLDDGRLFGVTLRDYSQNGANVVIAPQMENGEEKALRPARVGDHIELVLPLDARLVAFPAIVRRVRENDLGETVMGLELVNLTIKMERDLTAATFGRADAWAKEPVGSRNPFAGSSALIAFAWRGYRALFKFAPPMLRPLFKAVGSVVAWVFSFIPRPAGRSLGLSTIGRVEGFADEKKTL